MNTTDELVEQFLSEKFGISKSVNTRNMYDSTLSNLQYILREEGYDLLPDDLEDLTREEKIAYSKKVASLLEEYIIESNSEKTRQFRRSVANSFYSSDFVDGFPNPVEYILTDRPRKAVNIDASTLKEALNIDASNSLDLRDAAIILILFDWNKQVADVARLTTSNIVFREHKLYVKRNFEEVELHPTTTQIMRLWLMYIAKNVIKNGKKHPLWVSFAPKRRNKPGQLTSQGIRAILKNRLGESTPTMDHSEFIRTIESMNFS